MALNVKPVIITVIAVTSVLLLALTAHQGHIEIMLIIATANTTTLNSLF